jgi:hypothetical protein
LLEKRIAQKKNRFAILTELAGKTFCNLASWTEAGSAACSDTMKNESAETETELTEQRNEINRNRRTELHKTHTQQISLLNR